MFGMNLIQNAKNSRPFLIDFFIVFLIFFDKILVFRKQFFVVSLSDYEFMQKQTTYKKWSIDKQASQHELIK